MTGAKAGASVLACLEVVEGADDGEHLRRRPDTGDKLLHGHVSHGTFAQGVPACAGGVDSLHRAVEVFQPESGLHCAAAVETSRSVRRGCARRQHRALREDEESSRGTGFPSTLMQGRDQDPSSSHLP